LGKELECTLRYRGRSITGKAYLETDFVLFRGEERLKAPFCDLKEVKAEGGILKLEFPGGPAALELGAAAEKWARKILNPPSRLDKLGVKPGLSLRLVGEFEPSFLEELRARRVAWTAQASKAKHDLVFFAAATSGELTKIPRLAATMKPDGGLWVVFPKGVAVIREINVLESGRAAGLKDVKVARFSATHTALKFVIPVAARR
jgi:hypothetical protein